MEFYIGEAREKAGISFRELSDETCIAKSYLQKLEKRGGKLNPSACVLCRLAKALDVPVGDLFACDP